MEKNIINIEVEAVKIIGKIKGIDESIELIMDKEVFFKWKEKLK